MISLRTRLFAAVAAASLFGACNGGDITKDHGDSYLVCHKVDDETKCVSTDKPPTGDFHCANGVDGTHDGNDDSDNDGIKDEHDCDLMEDKPGDDKPGEPGDDKPGEPGDDKPGDAKPTELEKYCAEHPDAEKCSKDEEPRKEEPPSDEVALVVAQSPKAAT